jgi:hypothetical protein
MVRHTSPEQSSDHHLQSWTNKFKLSQANRRPDNLCRYAIVDFIFVPSAALKGGIKVVYD